MFPQDAFHKFLAEMDRQDAERKAIIDSVLSKSMSAFKLPSNLIPKLEVDFKRIEKIINDNSTYGWTLTQEINFKDYLKDNLLNAPQRKKDEYFYDYYSKNDWKNYYITKDTILESINPKWLDLINDCFDSFEQDKYKMIIPVLFSIIEGETAFVYDTKDASTDLFKFIRKKAENEKDELTQMATYSLIRCLHRQLFVYHEFDDYRKELINRNWVLHGRDEPKRWNKVDALRLFNVISTIQLVKNYKNS